MNTDRFKFRVAVKQPDNSFQIFDVEGIYWTDAGLFAQTAITDFHIDGKNAILEQCTGLKDKNGKLIFEGDICEDSLGNRFTVTWDSDNGRFLGFTIPQKMIIYVGREPCVEVIGNIHETTSE